MSARTAGGRPTVSEARINVLGPGEVVALIDGKSRTIAIDPDTPDAALREIAVRGSEGARHEEIARRLQRANGYDAVNKLRALLKVHGLTISHSPYRLSGVDEGEITVTSDLATFRDTAQAALSADAGLHKRRHTLEPAEVIAVEALLEIPLSLWRWRTPPERIRAFSRFPGDEKSEDLLLDARVRLALARVRVMLAEMLASAAMIDSARLALSDLYLFSDSTSERKALSKRLRDVQKRLDVALDVAEDVEVFLSAPMASTNTLGDVRELAMRVREALCDYCGVSAVFSALDDIATEDEFELPSVAMQRNLAPFQAARAFVMILPEALSSSVLVEAGMALAYRIPSVYFVRNRDDLPWMLREIGADKLAPTRIIPYNTADDLVNKIKNSKKFLFPQPLDRRGALEVDHPKPNA